MKMPKHSDEDKARFRALVPDGPDVEVKPMFGSVGAFVNGNMFAGLFGTDIGVKLDDEAKAELGAIGAAHERLALPALIVLRRRGDRLDGPRPRSRRDLPTQGEEEVTRP